MFRRNAKKNIPKRVNLYPVDRRPWHVRYEAELRALYSLIIVFLLLTLLWYLGGIK